MKDKISQLREKLSSLTKELREKGFIIQSLKFRREKEGELFSHTIERLHKIQGEIYINREYLSNIITSMIDTLIVVDPDAMIKTINKATLDLLGYKEEELIGMPVATIFAEEEEEEEEKKNAV